MWPFRCCKPAHLLWGRVSFLTQRMWAGVALGGALNRNWLQTLGQQSVWKLPAVGSAVWNYRFALGWRSTEDLVWGTPCWRSCSQSSRDFLLGKRPRTRHRWSGPTGGTRGDTFTCRRPQTSKTSTWRSDMMELCAKLQSEVHIVSVWWSVPLW